MGAGLLEAIWQMSLTFKGHLTTVLTQMLQELVQGYLLSNSTLRGVVHTTRATLAFSNSLQLSYIFPKSRMFRFMVCENERFSISLLHYFSNQKSAGRKGKITKTKILGKLLEEKFQISAEMDYSLKFLSFRAIEISRQNLLLAETDVL